MAAKFTVSTPARDVLSRSEIVRAGPGAWSLRLPAGQLERKLYEDVNKVLTAAGGRWNRGGGVHVFDSDPTEALGLAVTDGTAVNQQQLLQSFYTPDPLADEVVGYADLRPGMKILEPNIGLGALADACVRVGVDPMDITGCDIDPRAVAAAAKKGYAARLFDFLEMVPTETFDAVVMNPPFTKGQDILHLIHAYKFLKPGGRLVSITSPSWKSSSLSRAVAFREWVMGPERAVQLYDVDEGAFRESGTMVATVIVVVDKPKAAAKPTLGKVSIKDRFRAIS